MTRKSILRMFLVAVLAGSSMVATTSCEKEDNLYSDSKVPAQINNIDSKVVGITPSEWTQNANGEYQAVIVNDLTKDGAKGGEVRVFAQTTVKNQDGDFWTELPNGQMEVTIQGSSVFAKCCNMRPDKVMVFRVDIMPSSSLIGFDINPLPVEMMKHCSKVEKKEIKFTE